MPPKQLAMPADLAAALAKSRSAQRHFDDFAPGDRREYIEWVVEAKRAIARQRRIEQAVEWIADGKHRNWKYEGC